MNISQQSTVNGQQISTTNANSQQPIANCQQSMSFTQRLLSVVCCLLSLVSCMKWDYGLLVVDVLALADLHLAVFL